jgi:hypothetical protein
MKVITETRRTWWRLLQKHVVPDEGYYRNTSYLMKVITETRRTWWRLLQKHAVPDEGYYRNASCALNLISTFLLGPLDKIVMQNTTKQEMIFCYRGFTVQHNCLYNSTPPFLRLLPPNSTSFIRPIFRSTEIVKYY